MILERLSLDFDVPLGNALFSLSFAASGTTGSPKRPLFLGFIRLHWIWVFFGKRMSRRVAKIWQHNNSVRAWSSEIRTKNKNRKKEIIYISISFSLADNPHFRMNLRAMGLFLGGPGVRLATSCRPIDNGKKKEQKLISKRGNRSFGCRILREGRRGDQGEIGGSCTCTFFFFASGFSGKGKKGRGFGYRKRK